MNEFPDTSDTKPEIVALAEDVLYVHEHGLQWVINILYDHADQYPIDEVFDYEFVVKHHRMGVEFPSDPKLIMAMFLMWLENVQHS